MFRLAGSEEEEEEGEWKLYFKLYCFLDVESMPKEGVEFAFMFEQVTSRTQLCAVTTHQIIQRCIFTFLVKDFCSTISPQTAVAPFKLSSETKMTCDFFFWSFRPMSR